MPETTSKTRKYKVEVIETLNRVVEVEVADGSPDEAIRIVRQLYRKEEIVLTDNDYFGTEFKLVK